METTKLYYEDAYLREFDAAVLSCREEQGRYLVVLDRTAFYPEGGGQPADHGVLGGVAVTDVQERDGVVCHTCAGPLAVGSTVHGAIDWQRRFDHMQQHSGEHIVSGMLCAAFHCDNVGFHMGTDVVTIDYNADIRWEQVLEVERQANRYIWEDHPCRVTFPSPAEREALPYRSKKALSGDVRIVDVPGCDRCACCGVHVRSTGEIGLIKVLSSMKHRGGTRVFFVCGIRALRDYEARIRETRAVSALLSAKPLEISSAVERVLAESAAKDARIAAMNRTIFDLKADAIPDQETPLVVLEEGFTPFELRQFCVQLSEAKKAPFIAVMSETEPGVMSYVCAIPDDLLRPVSIALNKRLNGRGGGAKGFVQGSWKADETAVREAVAAVWAEHTA